MNEIYDSIIIGSGIAGMTSAIYLKRYNKKILLLEQEIVGGQIVKASTVENYPGFTKIDGATLSSNIYEQILNLDIQIKYEKVVELDTNEKIVKTNNNEYKAKSIIIATGRRPRPLNIGEEKYIGHGISYCATCDGMFYKNKDVVIVGAGNSALEESLYLASICKNITILNRSNTLKADSILQEKVKQKENIKILYNVQINKILENNNIIRGILLNNNDQINCEGIFVYIGLIPNIDFLLNTNIVLENNYIIVDNKQETNIKGIYAVGDVTKKDLYQIITASSEGAIAASQINKQLEF